MMMVVLLIVKLVDIFFIHVLETVLILACDATLGHLNGYLVNLSLLLFSCHWHHLILASLDGRLEEVLV